VKRWIALLVAVSLAGLAGCRADEDKTAGAAPTATGTAATTATGATPRPAPTGPAAKPWQVSLELIRQP
jgi:hypothetical protein